MNARRHVGLALLTGLMVSSTLAAAQAPTPPSPLPCPWCPPEAPEGEVHPPFVLRPFENESFLLHLEPGEWGVGVVNDGNGSAHIRVARGAQVVMENEVTIASLAGVPVDEEGDYNLTLGGKGRFIVVRNELTGGAFNHNQAWFEVSFSERYAVSVSTFGGDPLVCISSGKPVVATFLSQKMVEQARLGPNRSLAYLSTDLEVAWLFVILEPEGDTPVDARVGVRRGVADCTGTPLAPQGSGRVIPAGGALPPLLAGLTAAAGAALLRRR